MPRHKKRTLCDGKENGRQVINLRPKVRRHLKMFNKSAPDRIFRVPKEKYEEAMKILEIDPPAAPDFRCIQHEFMPQRPARASAAIVSEDRYYKELMACLESGDLESYVSVASGAASIRKAFMFEKNDLICSALTALFYYSKAKEKEVFDQCLESLFNTRSLQLGSASNIIRSLMHCFPTI